MRVIRHDNPIPFDVDGVLVIDNFGRWPSDHPDLMDIDINGTIRTVMPAVENIAYLKQLKKEGKLIFLWSQSGYLWAEKVMYALHLEDYVEWVMRKPMGYIDDNPAHTWMERQYIRPAVLDTAINKEEPKNPLFESINLYQPLTDAPEGVTINQQVEGQTISIWSSTPQCKCGGHEGVINGDLQICTKCGADKPVPRF